VEDARRKLPLESIRRQYRTLLEATMNHYWATGEFNGARGYSKDLLDTEPWLEEAYRLLMTLLAQLGPRPDARSASSVRCCSLIS